MGFNPRTPYGVRHTLGGLEIMVEQVSIHALHTECDSENDAN